MLKRSFSPDQSGRKILFITIIIAFAFMLTSCSKKTTSPEGGLSAPSNLQITLIVDNQIKLNWIDNSTNETKFLIDRKEGVFDWFENYGEVEANITAFTDNIPTNSDTVYSYRVRAFDGNDYSEYSVPVGWFAPCTAPTNLQLEQFAQDSIKLTWQDNSIGELNFRIDRKIGSEEWEEEYKILEPDTTTYIDYNPSLYDTCYYKVFAACGDSYSDSTQNYFIPFLPAPSNLEIDTLYATSVKLTWQDNCEGEDGYLVYKKEDESDWDSTNVPPNTEEWTDEDVIPGIVNYYKVCAYVDSNYSAYIEANINTLPAPTNLQIEQLNVTNFKLIWQDNSIFEQGFKIDRKIDNEEWINELGYVDSNITEWIDNSVGRNYEVVYYRVYGYYEEYNSNKIESNSNIVFPDPSNLTYEKLTISSIKLNWTDNSNGEDGFKIDKKVGENYWQLDYVIIGENVEEWTDENAEINETIQYRIYAYCGNNISASIETGEIDNTFPAPSDLTYQKLTISSINLNWIDNSNGEDGFKIDKKVGENEWQLDYAIVGENIEEWTDENAEINETIQYRIYAYCGNNSSNSIETGEIDNSIPAPSNLDIEVLSETFVKLTWQDNSEFEDGFKIDHKSGEENWEICYGLVEINIEEWVDTEPVSGEVNYYRVYAYSGIYYSLYAQDSIYLFNDTIPPSKVHLTPHLCDVGDPGCTDRTNGIDAVPTGSELTYNWMKIQWDGTPLEIDGDIHHIDIFRFYITINDTVILFVDQIVYEPDSTMYIDKFTDLEGSGIQITQREWYYYIIPYDEAGNFTVSDTVSYKLLSVPGLICPVNNAEFNADENIYFSWGNVSLAISYRILFFDQNYNLQFTQDYNDVGCNIVPSDSGLYPGNSYIWRIDAFGMEYDPGKKSGSESEERIIHFIQ